MGEIVNLNKARKTRDKQERAAQAAENRLRFGRTKRERDEQLTASERAQDLLDGKRFDPET